ncbi:hypothetical protein YPPY98_2355, partial [Yersinia pestis PY-98]|jgi:hypothetical protein
MPPK